MSAPRPPPPTNYERPYGWWERRSKLGKAAIVICGFVCMFVVLGILGNICFVSDPAPNVSIPTPTRVPHPYGHHCLSPWDGHHPFIKAYLTVTYSSAEVQWTETTELRANGMHRITVGWTGENKWGDPARAEAQGWLDPGTCEVTMEFWE